MSYGASLACFRMTSVPCAVSPLGKWEPSRGFSRAPAGMQKHLCHRHHLTHPNAKSRKTERGLAAARVLAEPWLFGLHRQQIPPVGRDARYKMEQSISISQQGLRWRARRINQLMHRTYTTLLAPTYDAVGSRDLNSARLAQLYRRGRAYDCWSTSNRVNRVLE